MVIGGRRIPRWTLALGAVLVALGAAATLGPALLNLEQYRGLIARQAGRAIGREVTVGAITANLWRLGAEAQGIRVAERPGYGAAPFVDAEGLRVRVELLPLLRGQLRVASAVLERPRIHLVRDREGHWNIEDLWHVASGPTAGAHGRPGPEVQRPPRPAAAGALLVRDLRAWGGELVLEDLGGGSGGRTQFSVANLRLEVHQQEDPRDGLTLTLAGTAAGGTLEATAVLSPKGPALTVDGRAAVKGFDLAALGPYLGRPGMSGPADISITAKGSLPSPGLDVAGNLDLTRARLDLGGPARKGPGEDGRLTFAGHLAGEVPAGLRLELPKLRLQWRGMAADGRLTVSRFQPLEMTFAAETARVDLDLLLPPSAPDASAGKDGKTSRGPGIFGAAVAHAATPGGAPQGAGPGGGDRPAGAAIARSPTQPSAPGAPAHPIRANGTLRAGAVRWRNLEAKDVQGVLAYRDAVLTVKDLKGGLAGGRLSAAGSMDLRGRHPGANVTFRLEGAQLQPLMAAFPRAKFEAHGVLTTEGKISAPALVPGDENALGALVGSGSITVVGGRVVGYKPLERLSSTLESLRGGGLKARLDQFERLTATYTLDKGFLRTKDLTLTRPDGQSTAAGSLNLLDQALNFDVTVRLGKASLEAKVLGTAAEPIVTPTVARLDRRFDLEIDRSLKGGDRGKAVRDLLRNLLR
jgi:AsmA protein